MFAFQLALENMKSVSADILLFPETNIHWSDYNIIQSTNRHRRNTFNFSKQVNSHSQLHYDTPYQPGGTTSIITDNLIGRYHSSSSDMVLGRWSVIHLTLPNDTILTIVCCYQVCEQHIDNIGPKTAYSQQWSILRQQGQRNPHPRRQFYIDLERMLSRFHEKGHQLILAGDFNATLGDDSTGLDRILHKFNLIDPILHQHGPYQCSTYARGNKCIDYILISRSLLPAVLHSGIPGFDSVMSSDHRPIFLDLNTKAVLGDDLPSLATPPHRRLFSTNPTRRESYLSNLYQSCTHHRLFHRARQLQSLDPSSSQAIALCESIDRDLTRLMIASEKRLRRPSPMPFSSTLAQACIKVSLLKSYYLELCHGTDKSHTISKLQQRLHQPLSLPSSIDDLKVLLHTTRKEVKKIRRESILHQDEFLQTLSLSSDLSKIIHHIRKAKEMRRGFSKI